MDFIPRSGEDGGRGITSRVVSHSDSGHAHAHVNGMVVVVVIVFSVEQKGEMSFVRDSHAIRVGLFGSHSRLVDG